MVWQISTSAEALRLSEKYTLEELAILIANYAPNKRPASAYETRILWDIVEAIRISHMAGALRC